MIAFRCGKCGQELQVHDDLAGQAVPCFGCGTLVAVPLLTGALSSGAKTIGQDLAANLEKAKTLPDQDQIGLESVSDTNERTGFVEVRKGEATQGFPGEASASDGWDFLGPAEKPDELGRLGPYRVLKVLGAGGMGVVFQAEDPHLERLVALKAMLPGLAVSATAKQRFFREARAAAGLKHPHIVTIFQVGEDRGIPYLAMEFLEGESLDQRLKRDVKMPMAEVISIGIQIAEGLSAAHAKGLIHRDIKPANIWLEENVERGAPSAEGEKRNAPHSTFRAPQVKILDFGLARAMQEQTHLTHSGAIVGTPAYMAPEQASGGTVDHRCDLFSLGCVLYCMCTNQTPFKGKDTLSILSALALVNPEPPLVLNAEVPAELSNLVMHLLAKNPENRPESAQAVAEMLQDCARHSEDFRIRPRVTTAIMRTGAAMQAGARTETMPGSNRKKSLWRWYGTGGVLCLGMAMAVGIFFGGPAFFFKEKEPETIKEKPPEPRIDPGEVERRQEEIRKEEQQRRKKIADDALARVKKRGQEIVTAAYPLAIGGVTYLKSNLEGVASTQDGYQVTVKLNYTNVLKDDYFLEILISYDSQGGYRSWTIGNYNDRIPPSRQMPR